MRQRGILRKDRGVSEVIDEVLLVAIVVILAAVVGGHFFGLGVDLGVGPTTSVSITDANEEYSTNYHAFSVKIQSGDRLDPDEMEIVIRDKEAGTVEATLTPSDSTFDGDDMTAHLNDWSTDYSSTAQPGDIINLKGSGDDSLSENTRYEIVLVHTPSEETVASGTVQLR